jgi:hypothetical protein
MSLEIGGVGNGEWRRGQWRTSTAARALTKNSGTLLIADDGNVDVGLGWGEKMWSFPFRREAVFQGLASSKVVRSLRVPRLVLVRRGGNLGWIVLSQNQCKEGSVCE